MAKGSGGTRAGGSRNPNGVASPGGGASASSDLRQRSEANIRALRMPSNYGTATVQVGGREYGINRAPTGYGRQQQRNGRFTVMDNSNPSNYRDFRYGDSYAGYTSPREAFSELKAYLRSLNR